LLWKRRHDAAVAQFERAFALNPNFIDHRFGLVLIMVGEPARAIEMLEANLRLDPFAPVVFSRGLTGSANYMLGRYAEAVVLLTEWTSRHPNLQVPHLWLASAHAQLGEIEAARAEAAEVLRINPVSQSNNGRALSSTSTLKTSSIVWKGCARRGCPRVDFHSTASEAFRAAGAWRGADLAHIVSWSR
jgi:tetratricopeptide (TPR) repeat protein